MAKLNQIIAIEKGAKENHHKFISEIYKTIQKPELFSGFSKTYSKINEESEDLPPDTKKVQFTYEGIFDDIKSSLSDLFDITARKEYSNTEAKGSISIGGLIYEDIPITYLLFMEKQLTDIRTFIKAMPTLDENDDWTQDPNSDTYRTESLRTHRTKKVQRPIVLYDATAEHPAQTEMITEDQLVGYWNTVKRSGAMPSPQKKEMIERVENLIRAVKMAREEANSREEMDIALLPSGMLDYIFQ